MWRNIVFTLFLTFFFTCDEELDIDPSQGINEEVALSDENNITALLVATYAEIREEGALGGTSQIISDLLGTDDELTYQGFWPEPREFLLKEITVTNERVNILWFNYYRVINMANLIIDNAHFITSSQEKQDKVIGEAKFLRAFSYFELIKLFASPYVPNTSNTQLGVPLRLTGITDYSLDHSLERSSVEVIYNQIESDLNDANLTLPETNDFFADKYSASSLLARVYLQKGNYQEALNLANQVLEQSNRALVPEYSLAFNNDQDSSEDIFAIQLNSQEASDFFEGTTYLITLYASFDNGGLGGFISLNDEFFELFDDPDDYRRSFFYISPSSTLRLTSKYTNKFGNVPIIRLSEMYLIRAETNLRLGSNLGQTPLDDINTIRQRVNASLLTEVDLETILLERQLELSFEGHLIHDLKRTNQIIGELASDDPRLVLPIPIDEINTNTLIEQNPGY